MNISLESIANQIEEELASLGLFKDFSEGAIAIDRDGRISWINEKYARLILVENVRDVIGVPIDDVIPESRLPEIVRTGTPVMLDIMRIHDRHFVVCRLPLRDASGNVTGALGVVFFSELEKLNPLIERYRMLER